MNVFLFEVTGNKEQSTLGELKKSSQNLILQPQHGYFLLKAGTDNPLALARAGEKYQFEIASNNSQLAELKFEGKSEMFKFLVSQEGKEFKFLALDQTQIFDKSRDVSSVKSVDEVGSDPRVGVEMKEPQVVSDDQNNIVDVQTEEAVVVSSFASILEEEVRDMRNELEVKDEVIEKQTIENKKMKEQLKEVGHIVSSSLIHEEQQNQHT